MFSKYFHPVIRYTACLFFSGMMFLLFFRVLFVSGVYEEIRVQPHLLAYLKNAFVIGLKFDAQAVSYILIIPFALLTLAATISRYRKFLNILSIGFVSLLFILMFLLCSADIPWFSHNFSRLNVAVLNWTQTPGQMFRLVFSETGFLAYFILFLIVSGLFLILNIFLYRRILEPENNYPKHKTKNSRFFDIILIVMVFGLLISGMRGNIKAPLKRIDACISGNPVINQIGLNPVFTFVKSLSDKIAVLNTGEALNNTREYLDIVKVSQFDSPLARIVEGGKNIRRMNVVLIIMESMAAVNLERFGNNEKLTPNIDSLAKISICFDNFWSCGKHTSVGIFSSIYAMPGIWSVPPTLNTNRAVFSGLPGTLKQSGYQTSFFINHDLSYDNLREFLKPNHFDTAIDGSTYPAELHAGMYGVPDHVMFERGISELTKLYETGELFFSVFVTSSNHKPYHIPHGIPFNPVSAHESKKIIEYSDWSVGHFMKLASEKPWYDSTIFVFTADHGFNTGKNIHEIPLEFHHIPLLIYSETIGDSCFITNRLGSQLDIYPTVMGMLNIKYVNNTAGMDLLRNQRPFVYFSEDDKMVCLNNNFIYFHSKDNNEKLINRNNGTGNNKFYEFPDTAAAMKKYMFSFLQTVQWMSENKKAGVIQPE